jgi:hypothetical protein
VSSAPQPVDESVLRDLKDRLRGYRRIPLVEGIGWDRGTDADYLAELVAYWAQTYQWREHEKRILDRPWVRTETGGTRCEDLVPVPREFGERIFDIRERDEEPSGGHFGAWERPEAYVAGLRKAIALA